MFSLQVKLGVMVERELLAGVTVLIVDCQTTGAPGKGNLLEVGWLRTTARAGLGGMVQTRLVALPDEAKLPKRVSALTGIRPADLHDAPAPVEVAQKLSEAAKEPHFAVAHFARFEQAYLDDLFASHTEQERFPLPLVCTHAVARRLLPDLPRLGLRAVAGFLGHVVQEEKRAHAHVLATAHLWASLVPRLATCGVATVPDLLSWMTSTPAKPRGRKTRAFPMSRAERLALPRSPGVYRMEALGGKVLYVGKATSLRTRVNSYFQKRHRGGGRGTERALELLSQVQKIDITKTASVLEAALAEHDEIKRLSPPYNRALRDRDEPWFVSKSLGRSGPTCSKGCFVGPLPGHVCAQQLSALKWLVGEQVDPRRFREGIAFPSEVDDDLLRAGMLLFRQAHQHSISAKHWSLVARVLRIGARLGRERRSEDPKVEEGLDKEWNPAAVAHAAGSAAHRAASLIRRAHLLCRLMDATVAFRSTRSGRLLLFEAGELRDARPWDPQQEVSVPPGWQRPLDARKSLFDSSKYDRLRVLSTELRRLCAQGATLSVRLSPQSALSGPRLGRILSLF